MGNPYAPQPLNKFTDITCIQPGDFSTPIYDIVVSVHSQSPVRSKGQGGDGHGRDALEAEGCLETSGHLDGLCFTLERLLLSKASPAVSCLVTKEDLSSFILQREWREGERGERVREREAERERE